MTTRYNVTNLISFYQIQDEDSSKAINLLLKAYEKAKEGGHTYQEGVACYRLGNAYEGIQESQTAIQVSILGTVF